MRSVCILDRSETGLLRAKVVVANGGVNEHKFAWKRGERGKRAISVSTILVVRIVQSTIPLLLDELENIREKGNRDVRLIMSQWFTADFHDQPNLCHVVIFLYPPFFFCFFLVTLKRLPWIEIFLREFWRKGWRNCYISWTFWKLKIILILYLGVVAIS